MNKYIYEISNNFGQNNNVYKNKYMVVYENKTYYYCKVNGTDTLLELRRNYVDTHNSCYYVSNENLNNEDKFKTDLMLKKSQRYAIVDKIHMIKQDNFNQEHQIARSKAVIENNKNRINSCLYDLRKLDKEIKELESKATSTENKSNEKKEK